MTKGLSNADGAGIVAHRRDAPYCTIEELWRRAPVRVAALERLAEADAFRCLGLDRRRALWQVRGLADRILPLFAAADGKNRPLPEVVEQPVLLSAIKEGAEVVANYRAVGLTLRDRPVFFLRVRLRARRMIACADLPHMRDGRRVVVPGIVLVRQKPGSAKGVMFITIEVESGVANLVLWPDCFEKQRSLILSAGMIACHGRVQFPDPARSRG